MVFDPYYNKVCIKLTKSVSTFMNRWDQNCEICDLTSNFRQKTGSVYSEVQVTR